MDGFAKTGELFKRLKELSMDSVAITDHGVMFGIPTFYKLAKKSGIKPILGCEVYISKRGMEYKEVEDKGNFHLVLLAENYEGYKNLMKLVSIGYVDGFYYKPRVDKDTLKKYSKGLIALSACLQGEVSQAIIRDDLEGARELAKEYRDIFGEDNFFLEIQDHGMDLERKVNKEMLKISRELEIPLVATNDVHYLEKKDANIHDILLCIQTQTTVNEEKRMKFPSAEFYLKSPEEMEALFSEYDGAIANTGKIAERCNVDLEFGHYHLPRYYSDSDKPNSELLKDLVYKGLAERYGTITDEIRERADFELDTIISMGFTDYFLIVMDFISYAKNKDIPVGPGRGSAAGSIVSYALHITDIDPLRFSLLFERFLNPERVSMPDIDIDFCYERRGEVIDYVIEKYGTDNVGKIATFGTIKARGAIRDAARALEIPYNKADYIAKEIPNTLGITIDGALEVNNKLKKEYETDEETKFLVDIARQIEGAPRHVSTHAAGVVICEEPITEYVPLVRTKDAIATQFNMIELEELGLLKMDFLGLRNLTVIKDTKDLVKKTQGIDIEINDFEDEKVYEIFQNAETIGIFQFESAGMRRFLKELKPTWLEDLVAANALYRPGPMSQIPKFVEGKHNSESISYLHPSLEPILDVTYGCIVYQEQVIRILQDIGGFSAARADNVRRAISKKKMDVMEAERQVFLYGSQEGNVHIKGAIKNGLDVDSANKIYDLMIDFANYAFNKSHSAAYAVVAYETAVLKVHYPVEFMASLITSIMDNTSQVAFYIKEAERLGIEVLAPDVKESFENFTVKDGKILFGLKAVKNVGIGVIQAIINSRKKNMPETLYDFLKGIYDEDKTALNKRAIESLIRAGALDSFGKRRSQLMGVFEMMIESIQNAGRRNVEGQSSLFDESASFEEKYPNTNEFPKRMLLQMEKETLGIYISGHPLDPYREAYESISQFSTMDLMSLSEDSENEEGIEDAIGLRDGQYITMAGIVIASRVTTTKTNKQMAFIKIEDYYGEIEVIVFPNQFQKYSDLIREDMAIFVHGKVNLSEVDDAKIIAEEIKLLPNEREMESKRKKKTLFLKFKDKNVNFDNIRQFIDDRKGDTEVVIYFEKEKEKSKYQNGINAGNEVVQELVEKLGMGNVILQ